MEAQEQTQSTAGPNEEPAGITPGTTATLQQPVQDDGTASQEAHAIAGNTMNLPMGQLPHNNTPVFHGDNAGFISSQQPFNGNGIFSVPNMMVPPTQQMMTGANGTATKHAVNGNAISAGKLSNTNFFRFLD